MPMKRIVSLVVIILLVLSGCSSESNSNSYNVDYDDPESVYSAAQTMYKKQDVYNAKILFESISEYKDSQVCINKINCLIDLIGNYSMWNGSDFSTKVYVTPKYLQISGDKNLYYSDYEIVKFHTSNVSSDDLCIYYPKFTSSTGEGFILIKGSENITLFEVTKYDDNKNEYILGDFYWLMSDSQTK